MSQEGDRDVWSKKFGLRSLMASYHRDSSAILSFVARTGYANQEALDQEGVMLSGEKHFDKLEESAVPESWVVSS